MKLRPLGLLLGILGNVGVILAVHELFAPADLGGEVSTGYVLLLPAGIVVALAAALLGGGFVAVLGVFLSVGAGALWAAIDLPAGDDQKTFAYVLGGLFVALPFVLAVLATVGGPRRGRGA